MDALLFGGEGGICPVGLGQSDRQPGELKNDSLDRFLPLRGRSLQIPLNYKTKIKGTF